MESIIQQIKDSRNITESSLNLYKRNIKRLINESGSDNPDIFTSDATLAKLMVASNNTLASYIASCLVVLGLDKTKNRDRLEELNARLKEVNKNIKNGSHRKNKEVADLEDVIKLADKLRVHFFKTKLTYSEASDALLMSLYTLLPPSRSETFANLEIYTGKNKPEDNTKNYLWIKNKSSVFLVLNSFKTVKTHGAVIEQITDKVLVKMLVKFVDDFKTKYLFESKKKGESIKASDVSRNLVRLTKDIGALSSSSMRHLYLSKKYSKVMNDLDKDASFMLHNTSTSISNYIAD
jgi:hypothetical protein